MQAAQDQNQIALDGWYAPQRLPELSLSAMFYSRANRHSASEFPAHRCLGIERFKTLNALSPRWPTAPAGNDAMAPVTFAL
jgi:hypothetical protein